MEWKYNGSLTREQVLFFESRTVATLRCQGLDCQQILCRVQAENLFQYPTERMIASITKTCLQRLDALQSENLVCLLAQAPAEVARQVNLYAMMRHNRIVWEFMTGVIGEKFRTQDFSFRRGDVNAFLSALCEQNDAMAAWSEKTLQKIRQVLVRALVECDYLDSYRAETLHAISIAPELEDELRALRDFAALPAFNCFR